jgi:hypothetical protein
MTVSVTRVKGGAVRARAEGTRVEEVERLGDAEPPTCQIRCNHPTFPF